MAHRSALKPLTYPLAIVYFNYASGNKYRSQGRVYCGFIGRIVQDILTPDQRCKQLGRAADGQFLPLMTVELKSRLEKLQRRSGNRIDVLIVAEDRDSLEALSRNVEEWLFHPLATSDPQEALKLASSFPFKIAVLDVPARGADGVELLRQLKEIDPGIEVILITGSYSVESAVEAIKLGAHDYLLKPLNFSRLKSVLDTLREHFLRKQTVLGLEEELLKNLQFHDMVGRSPAMLDVFDFIRRIARHYSKVLISGETGTGKELAARALHAQSPVASKRFVVCDCTTLNEALMESQLFGHVRGAFTGANEDKIGLFEYADGGTLFLDEISELSLSMQAKFLRVLQAGEIYRVGSPKPIKVDVRVIAATNRDLREEVKRKRFREDLYFRLNATEIKMPPLRERREDIPLLCRYFLRKFSEKFDREIKGLTQKAQRLIMNYSWPGNVRELENVLEKACLIAPAEFIRPRELPPYLNAFHSGTGPEAPQAELSTLREMEKAYILKALEKASGNKVHAARMLGITPRSIYRRLKKHGIAP